MFNSKYSSLIFAVASVIIFVIGMITPFSLVLSFISLAVSLIGWRTGKKANLPYTLSQICTILCFGLLLLNVVYLITYLLANTILPAVIGNIV